MKTKLYLVAMAAAVLAACDEVRPVENVESTEMITLGVNIPDPVTKVSGNYDDAAVASLQVLVFDRASGMLEGYGRSSSRTLTLNCVPGSKNIVALANAPDMSTISSYSAFTSTVSRLTDNQANALVMEGSYAATLSKSTDITMPISRIASKVELTQIANRMALEYLKDKEFALTAVYLINAAGDKTYLSTTASPTTWYNKMAYETGTPSLLYDSLGGKLLDEGKTYLTPHYFYCYPNPTNNDANGGEWSARHTRLVVEAKLDGQTYYYAATLPKMVQNTVYKVSLTVTRPGSTSPDEPLDIESGVFSISVVDWRTGQSIDEVI